MYISINIHKKVVIYLTEKHAPHSPLTMGVMRPLGVATATDMSTMLLESIWSEEREKKWEKKEKEIKKNN